MKSEISHIQVRDVRHMIVKNPTVIHINRPFNDLLRLVLESSRTRHVYVLDDKKRMVGAVRMNKIVETLFPLSVISVNSNDVFLSGIHVLAKNSIREIMNKSPLSVSDNTYLSDVAEIMMLEGINELPVTDSDMHIIGQINSYEMISKYLEFLEGAKA